MPRPGCLCLGRSNPEVRSLDYRHSNLDFIPSDVFTHERTLEELNVDANRIRDLPRELFYCHGLRRLSVSDNELTAVPPAIATLTNLEELDISKNGVVDLPDNIKGCKYLRSIEASVNPLGKLPEGFTQLLQLTELFLNDAFLDFLPGSFGRLNKLRILELRENHLKTLPRSLTRLTELERLDIGNNEFTELPDVVGSMSSLQELWCDTNHIKAVPKEVGALKQLMFLDASKNRVESVASEVEGCVALADLHLSTNLLMTLPESLGRLSNLTTLKLDDNRLTSLPFSIGGLASLSELNVGANDLESLPASIGLLRHLRTLYADENFLLDIPPELGSCSGLTVVSLRSNNLTSVPDELGRIPRLRVLNLSDNKIRSLPFSLTKLKQLQALWLAENQTKPLIKLQSDIDIDTGQRVLTCYLLPQQATADKQDMYSDTDSFHPSMWEEERQRRQQIHFEFADLPDDDEGHLERTPTPYPKEMKQRVQHVRNLAMKQLGQTPNGHVPRPTAPSTPPVQSAVVGRRDTPTKSQPLSPSLCERHHLLKADKEKLQRDKERLNRRGSDSHGPPDSQRPGDEDDGGFSEHGSLPRSKPTNCVQPLTTQSPRAPHVQSSHAPATPQSQRTLHSQAPPATGPPAVAQPTTSPSKMAHSNMPPPTMAPPTGAPPTMAPPTGAPPTMAPPTGAPPAMAPPTMAPPTGAPPTMAPPPEDMSYTEFQRGLSTRGVAVPRNAWSAYHKSQSRAHRSSAPRRTGRGYESDTGYRSDFTGYRHTGYISDQGRHVQPRARREAGYSSDLEGQRRQPAPRGHAAHSSVASLNRNYSNPALTKRATIRNDEMYGYQPSPAHRAASLSGPPAGYQAPRTTYFTRTTEPPPQSEHSLQQPIKEEHDTGGSGDERWKSQLLEASVKLQKAPSLHRLQEQSDPVHPQSPDMARPRVLELQPGALPRQAPPDSQQSPHKSHNQTFTHSPMTPQNKPRPQLASSPHTSLPTPHASLPSSQSRLPSPNHASLPTSCQANLPSSQPGLPSSQPSLPSSQPGLPSSQPLHVSTEPGGVGWSQFEHDVAVYKLPPCSQVSSSTDSGYGHPDPRLHPLSPVGMSPVTPTHHADRASLHRVSLTKDPGLGFSIAGGLGSTSGNPYDPHDSGVFITRVQEDGPGAQCLRPGDKIVEVNGVDFTQLSHDQAVESLRGTPSSVTMAVHRH